MTDLKDKALAVLDSFSDLDTQTTLVQAYVRGHLSLIPVIGEAIITILDARGARLWQANFERFAAETRACMEGLGESKVDKGFIESDEFVALVGEVLRRNGRVYQIEKIQLYARVFVNSLTEAGCKVPYKEGFLRLIDEISAEHVRLLRELHHRPHESMDFRDLSELVGLAFDRALAYGRQMQSLGLLEDVQVGRLDYEPGHYRLTEYGGEFCEFLSTPR